MNKIKLEVTPAERILIVAALMAYGALDDGLHKPARDLAQHIGTRAPYDPADDGPEVKILRDVDGIQKDAEWVSIQLRKWENFLRK